jgi:Ca2+-binding EF-hand superfamily protein
VTTHAARNDGNEGNSEHVTQSTTRLIAIDALRRELYKVASRRFRLASGTDSAAEVQRVLHAKAKVTAIDSNEDGEVSFAEFENYHVHQGLVFVEFGHHLRKQFDVYDRDSNSMLNEQELCE